MGKYIAVIGFEDDQLGRVKRNASLTIADQLAERYVKAKLIKRVGAGGNKPNPTKAAGTLSSVSPAAPVSPQKTVKKQRSGSRKMKGVQSS